MIKLNGKTVIIGKFPNKECNLPIQEMIINSYNRIDWMFESDTEFFYLALLKDYLDSQITKSEICIHYMPHSRMDRNNGIYAFSLKTACKLVNAMNFEIVRVIEPHSDVTPALLDNSFPYEWCMEMVDSVVESCNAVSLFFPDAGAAKRYGTRYPYAIGNKLRDFETGNITSFDLTGEVGKVVLIVDDLCSRGGTFVHSAKLLQENGAEEIYLLVAHCETTVYKGELFKHIDHLYTGNHNQGIVASDCITLL